MGSGRRLAVLFLACLVLAACAGGERKAPVQQPASGGYKVGKPYQVSGVWYYPATDYTYIETGIASWYGPDFHGLVTANGETYDMNDLTAAHRTLPMPSMVRVTNLENGRQLALRVNDRGPFVNNRIIDVSRRAAQLLGFDQRGTARVRVEIMADDSRQLAMLAGAAVPRAAATGQTATTVSPQVTAAPAGVVTTETLAPPSGTAANLNQQPKVAKSTSTSAVGAALVSAGPQPDGKVTTVPVRRTSMFIQAGAFASMGNADRLKKKLAPFGRAQVVPAVVGSQRFYRVRVGPIATLAEADNTLAKIVAAGHSEARLIVD